MDLELPPRMHMREYMFEFAKGKVRRHLTFKTEAALMRAVKRQKPKSIYASVAYYQHPGNHTMERKGRYQSDMPFDLDYDHMDAVLMQEIIEGREIGQEEALGICLEQARTLKKILIEDFGFEKLREAFSGNRGFHIHVEDDSVQGLGNAHRREIVDYVVAKGIGIDEPVSSDLQRMMRIPGSYHIKSGKMCRRVDLDTVKVEDVWRD